VRTWRIKLSDADARNWTAMGFVAPGGALVVFGQLVGTVLVAR
jgi:hypothetical protein